MDENDEPSQIAELATEAVAPIEQELRRRLDVELGERDVLAVETALLKAFLGGMGAGLAEAAETALERGPMAGRLGGERLPANVALEQPQLPHLDPWAQRYGEDR
jgi:hypothetical protein